MVDKHPNAPRGHQVGTGWPAWRYGPNEQVAIFQTESEVPVGWCSRQDRSDPKEAPPMPISAEIAEDVGPISAPVPSTVARRPLTLKRNG